MKTHKKIQQKILEWYKKNQRQLPWRITTNPYHILISEIMLQQTQVDRVIPYYNTFLQTFPTLKDLATANKQQLLQHWSGLGYNNRILRLQQTAQTIIKKYQGKLPTTYEELITLPGIGPYTARAILAFAYNQDVPVIDTNIRRVILHELHLPATTTQEQLETLAQQLLPKGQSRTWHNALMDYGALILTTKKTGIKPLSKQPTFKGSQRQLRGQIIKHLLQQPTTLQKLKKKYEDERLPTILEQLREEGFITITDTTISLAP